MALVVDGANRDLLGFGFLDELLGNSFCHREAEAPISVHHESGRRFLFDLDLRAWDDVSFLDTVAVGDDAQDAV